MTCGESQPSFQLSTDFFSSSNFRTILSPGRGESRPWSIFGKFSLQIPPVTLTWAALEDVVVIVIDLCLSYLFCQKVNAA